MCRKYVTIIKLNIINYIPIKCHSIYFSDFLHLLALVCNQLFFGNVFTFF